MIEEDKTKLKNTIKYTIKHNPKTVKKYKNGQRGLIGNLLKKVIKKTTVSLYSKESKKTLVVLLKKELSSKTNELPRH